MQKRAQMELSFGMIFSIILIIAFITFAFYGIKMFLGVQKSAETGKFLNEFKADVDRVWKSAQSSERAEYFLPSVVSDVCFVNFASPSRGPTASFYEDLKKANYGSENLVFYPLGSFDLDSVEIKNINLDAITEAENPYCVENENGKISLVFVKDLDDALVKIRR